MRKIVLGLVMAAALTGVALPAYANEVVQEVRVREDYTVIREYALKQLIIQRTYINGLIERNLLTQEQAILMLDALEQQEVYIRSEYFDPRNMFGQVTGNLLPVIGQENEADHDRLGQKHSSYGMMSSGKNEDMMGKCQNDDKMKQSKIDNGMMDKCEDKMSNKMSEGKMDKEMMANGSCSMMQQNHVNETSSSEDHDDVSGEVNVEPTVTMPAESSETMPVDTSINSNTSGTEAHSHNH